jgi:hypothetical protein
MAIGREGEVQGELVVTGAEMPRSRGLVFQTDAALVIAMTAKVYGEMAGLVMVVAPEELFKNRFRHRAARAPE